jgi:CRISPR type II-A-associated protein Csn2
MKLCYKPLDLVLDLDTSAVIELVIENRDYFATTLFDLYEAFEFSEGKWIASINDKTVTLDKNLYVINDYYFMLNPSKSRTVTTALVKQMTALAQSAEHMEQGQELVANVERFSLGLVDELGYGFEVSTDESFDIAALIKALGLRIFLNTDDLVARTIEFCDVLQTLTSINHFVLANAPALMGAQRLESLVRELEYHDHKALLLSSIPTGLSMPIQKIIVSEDLAVL